MFVSSFSMSASQPEYNKMLPALYESKELALAGTAQRVLESNQRFPLAGKVPSL